jgi:hypothetical protein
MELMPYLPLRSSETSNHQNWKEEKKNHKTVKLTRIPSDTLINS